MREISVLDVEAAVTELLTTSAYRLPADYLAALREARAREPSEVGRAVHARRREEKADSRH